MADTGKIRIAVAGLGGFGKTWVHAYSTLPDVADVGICDPDSAILEAAGNELGIERRHADLKEILYSDEYDAVHLVTPIPLHVEQSIAVMESGKHCACAIPMALTPDEVQKILAAQRSTGKTYMLMETEISSAAYYYAERMHRQGAFGNLQLMRGVYYQNMEGWPDYWRGLPPMLYCYHGLGPLLQLAGSRVTAVHCRGSSTLPKDQRQYHSPFSVESALFELEDFPAVVEITASFHQLVRGFLSDRFYVYGNRMSFESPQVAGEDPVIFEAETGPLPAGQRSRKVSAKRIALPPLADLVPDNISEIVRSSPTPRCIPLAHEFIRSIAERRRPAIDATKAANWTAAAICAHASSMAGGARVAVPSF